MAGLLDVRGRMLAAYGRTVTITRGALTGTALGHPRPLRPNELGGAIETGAMALEIGVPTGTLTVPQRGDKVSLGGRSWTVLSAPRVELAGTLLGYSLVIQGG